MFDLILQSMAFPNKAQQNDIRQSLPPLTGIYPTMNMMLTGKITTTKHTLHFFINCFGPLFPRLSDPSACSRAATITR